MKRMAHCQKDGLTNSPTEKRNLATESGGGTMRKVLLQALFTKQPVQIVYVDRHQRFTQRLIVIKDIEGQRVKAYCTLRKQHRTFDLSNILAVQKGRSHHVESKQTHAIL